MLFSFVLFAMWLFHAMTVSVCAFCGAKSRSFHVRIGCGATTPLTPLLFGALIIAGGLPAYYLWKRVARL